MNILLLSGIIRRFSWQIYITVMVYDTDSSGLLLGTIVLLALL